MLVLVLGLLHSVSGEAGSGTAKCTGHAVGNARGQIVDLATSLLLLAGSVLFTASLLKGLVDG